MEENQLQENSHIPKVSIGMPVYNGEKFIKKALDSLLVQTLTDFELIISDNASTDGTEEICRHYVAKDSRIRYCRQSQNRGGTWNFNFVLQEARCDYFMWAACDDFWEMTCLEKWVEVLDADDSVSLVFSNMKRFSHISGFLGKVYITSSPNDSIKNRLLIRILNPSPNLIYGLSRRHCLDGFEVELFDFSDVHFGYYMAIQGRIIIVNDFLFNAGIKGETRQPYSICGERITYLPFFRKCCGLVKRRFPFQQRGLFYIILLRQTILLYQYGTEYFMHSRC
jgi:glycosyltransferase involved in cell wall biosynthesis